MHPVSISVRRLAPTVVLALVLLAAFGVGPAGAAGVSGEKAQSQEFIPGVTDFPSRVEASFVPGVTDFPSRLGENGERAAEARIAQPSQQTSPVELKIDESGFDWAAGAAGAIAATLVLLGIALAVRTAKRSRVALG